MVPTNRDRPLIWRIGFPCSPVLVQITQLSTAPSSLRWCPLFSCSVLWPLFHLTYFVPLKGVWILLNINRYTSLKSRNQYIFFTFLDAWHRARSFLKRAFQVLKLAEIGTGSAASMFVINLDLLNCHEYWNHEHCNTFSVTPAGLQELRKYR